jgi:uncharacterized DUF497 family protein
MLLLEEPFSFEWDGGNRDKNLIKHRVTMEECEEIFLDPHKRILDAGFDSGVEKRYLLIGRTKGDRILFVVFTTRKHKIRVISARDLNRKERHLYEKAA